MRAAKQLQLDPAERQAARRLHNDVTSHLSEAGLVAGSFLQGSFARKTMLSPLHDVDKVVILRSGLAPIRPVDIMRRIESALHGRVTGPL